MFLFNSVCIAWETFCLQNNLRSRQILYVLSPYSMRIVAELDIGRETL